MSFITRDLLGNHHSSKLPDFKSENNYRHLTNQSTDQTGSKLQDLNQPPNLSLLDDTNLDLKLVSLSAASSPPYTLGEVKFALERVEKEHTKKRSISVSKSFKETNIDDEAYAAGCPSCLFYVLISSRNPKCPRCNMTVPSPTHVKKPRIDLNITI
ncbi:hypothetical protein L1987_55786 [Smallanthus sonchifolius]|uniref:Uncharacterized protein n=1 Tax=Smallanthus sonchifolius TaxID=185202 RepID=A0ACB9EBC9_9ASTR|nr:hypothetical protein L1987_55786 [Smallanthus sonchifolius]